MRRIALLLALAGLAGSPSARGDGILIPSDRSLPPLSLTSQKVAVTISGQVATTTVEQVYRNATDRDLEAEYLFPLPPDASVSEFAMWVGGRRLTAEPIEAEKARQTYEEIVRRLKDPGLLEYVDRDLWKVRIYPVPRRGEQKIEIRFTSLLRRDGDLIGYLYPLRTGRTARTTAGTFSLAVALEGPDPLGPIYSPSHDVAIDRRGDRAAVVSFEQSRYTLDADFQLYFAPRAQAVGISLLIRRETSDGRGYFLLLVSPRAGGAQQPVPRDVIVVVDTSSSMAGEKIRQAQGALRFALETLGPDDRFGLIEFATVVTPFDAGLARATPGRVAEAQAWVAHLEARGGTDIASALEEALKQRGPADAGRTQQVLFLTDGLPTVGRTDPAAIVEAVRTGAGGTRFFTFGVGDDVNAHLLDQVAEATRGASTYVRPGQDLEVKASALMDKLRHPVWTDLKLRVRGGVRLVEMYPPALPDLFRGEQLQVAGRYEGTGHVALSLEGRVGERRVMASYVADFPATAPGHDFLPALWAQRKVGYLLDQICLNGETSELRDEVIRLAREFGIATPYSSLLLVPDEPAPAPARRSTRAPSPAPVRRRAARPARRFGGGFGGFGGGMGGMGGGMGGGGQGGGGLGGGGFGGGGFGGGGFGGMGGQSDSGRASGAGRGVPAPRSARPAAPPPTAPAASSGKAAIDLAQKLAALKTDGRAAAAQDVRTAGGRRFHRIDGAWVDDRLDPSARTLNLRVLGTAYFRLVRRHPELAPILALGDRVVWVSPSGTAVVIGAQGPDDITDAALDRLFVPAGSK